MKWAAIWAMLGAAAAAVNWWIHESPKRRCKKKEQLKDQMREALLAGDTARVAYLERELTRLL